MLRACQQRLDEADDLARSAVTTFRKQEGNTGDLAEALARFGYVLNESKKFSEAIPCHGEAIALSRPKLSARCARIHHTAVHNLAHATLSSMPIHSALEGGLAQVREARTLLRPRVDGVPRHKLGWVEGLLWWKLGMHPRAIRALEISRRGFVRLALPYEIVLVSIDLAAAHCYFRDFDAAAAVAEDAFEHVQALKSDREAIAVLRIWIEAIQAGELSEEISTKTRQMVESRIGPGGCCRSRKK